MPTCRNCNEQIRWIKTKKGKSVPLDSDSIQIEDVKDDQWIGNDDGEIWKIEEDKRRPEQKDGPWYLTHFTTCKEKR